jgi:SAM-dependent methyltransferase
MDTNYLHGSSPEEQARLTKLNEILNEASLRELHLRGGEKIIDFGSGLGQLTRAMARAVGPGCRAIGIEQSPQQLAEARRQALEAGEEDLVDLRQGDATAPPLWESEWGSFDLAHARFLLEHVSDPLAVVRAMVRAVRPGGRVVLSDDDHAHLCFWPEPEGAMALWKPYVHAFERNGNDPYVGRRLVSLLHEAGAAPVRSTWVFFGASSGMPAFQPLVENMIRLFQGAREAMVEERLFDPARFDEVISNLRQWAKRPDAAFWLPMAWAEGARR